MENRKSNLEVLRLISIFLIILFHASMNIDNTMNFSHVFTVNMIPIFFIGSWGRLGVALFIIMSSWFLVDKKTDNNRGVKFVKISLETIFYTILSICVFSVIGLSDLDFKSVISGLLSPFIDSYWYVSSYLMLLLFFPIFNRLINNLNDEELKYIVVLLIVISDIWGLFVPSRIAKICGEFFTFITLYFWVAYLKRKPENWFSKNSLKKAIILFFIITLSCLLLCLSGTIFDISILIEIPVRIINNNSIFIDFLAIFVFYIFYKLDIPMNKKINILSRTTLGVYVLHTTPVFSSNGWDTFFALSTSFNTENVCVFTIHLFLSALLVFIVCMTVDLLRIYFIDSWFYKISFIRNIIAIVNNTISRDIF